jgi:AbrB family looped-hinge helix DNA binding protein
MDTATLSSKGQLVIPKHVRDLAHVCSGDAFHVQYVQGEIRLRPIMATPHTTLEDVAGCLASPVRKPLPGARIKTAIKERLKAQDLATRSARGPTQLGHIR